LNRVELRFFQKNFFEILNNKHFENLLPRKLPAIWYNYCRKLAAYESIDTSKLPGKDALQQPGVCDYSTITAVKL